MEQVILFNDSMSMFSGKVNLALNNTIKIPVILAREMIQYYGVHELPDWVGKQLPPHVLALPVLKPYSALKDSIQGIEKLPIIFHFHTSGFKDYEENDPTIEGWVKQLVADDKRKLIRGMAYINLLGGLTEEERLRIENGEVVDVSIGGSFILGNGGTYEDGRKYALSQEKIRIRH